MVVEGVKIDDKEIKVKNTVAVTMLSNNDDIITIFNKFSSWMKVIRIMTFVLKFIRNCRKTTVHVRQMSRKSKYRKEVEVIPEHNVDDLEIAKEKLLLLLQNVNFGNKDNRKLKKLDPFHDTAGILRVGGRYCNIFDAEFNMKHPIILPRNQHLSLLILRWCHESTKHSGRDSTLNEMRQNGFWIIGANNAVKSLIFKCVQCRELRAKSGEQKMASLPKDRVTPAPPFTFCGVDFFGPFLVKLGRKLVKRYGCIFTCLACRAVHIEVSQTLVTDSFILAWRRFISRRGNIRTLRCDHGTNFVGAENEFKKQIKLLDSTKIQVYLQEHGCQWIDWKMNPPTASHMGGAWERQIRSIKSILQSLLKTHGASLNDEALHTLLLEAECVVNSRPIVTETLGDPLCSPPLTPMMLLTTKTKLVLPPPGNFPHESVYSRKQWKRVQHIVNEFWQRWKKEYLQNMQARNKWQKKRRNFQIGDIVLIKDDQVIRNVWKHGIIDDVILDQDGICRSCVVKYY